MSKKRKIVAFNIETKKRVVASSVTELAKSINISRTNISDAINRRGKTVLRSGRQTCGSGQWIFE